MKGTATIFAVAFVLAGPIDLTLGEDQPTGLDTVLEEYSIIKPLHEALAELGDKAGVTIRVDWPALHAAGVSAETRVTLKGRNSTIRKLLDLALLEVMDAKHPLAWKLAATTPPTVVITTRQQIRLLEKGIANSQPHRPGQAANPPRQASRRSRTPGKVDFESTPLSSVIDFIRRDTGLNVYVNWGALAREGIEKTTPVTLHLRNVTYRAVLDTLMREISQDRDTLRRIYWVIDEGIVRISTGEVLDRTFRTRVIDAGGLLLPPANFTSPRVDVSALANANDSSGDGGSIESLWPDPEEEPSDEPTTEELRRQQRNSLVRVIKNSIGEEMWEPMGKGTIVVLNNRLVIKQSLLGWKLLQDSLRR